MAGSRLYRVIFLVAAAWPLICLPARGQEMLGVVNSNFAGVNSMMINPANAALTPTGTSVNLLAGDVFLISSYNYVNQKDYNFFKLFSLHSDDPQYMHIYDYPEFYFRDTVHYYDYFKNSKQKFMYANGRFAGPSFTVHFGRHAISFLSGWRNNFSAEKIPYHVANFIFRGQDFRPQHNITYDEGYFTFSAISWIELGLGYAMTVYKNSSSEIELGFALKGLLGTGAAFGTVNNVTYMVPNTDSIYFYKMNATVGLDLPMDYASNRFPVFTPFIRGTGFSGDIGITYVYTGGYEPPSIKAGGSADETVNKYRFRAGVSLLDAGYIQFNKEVQIHEFNNVENRLWKGLRNYQATSIQQFLRSASQNLLGDSLASITTKDKFTVYLPTALSVQADYNFGYNVFLNFTGTQAIRLGKPGVRRETLLSLTPRYETPIYEVDLPLSLVNWKYPAIGLALRVYNIVIGTEKLGTFLNLTNVNGIDLYVSIAFRIKPKSSKWGYKGPREGPCEAYPDYKRYQIKK